MKDTRALFQHLTVRKPGQWSDIPKVHEWPTLNEDQISALSKLPRFYFSEVQMFQPFDECLPLMLSGDHPPNASRWGCEVLVYRGQSIYYVNTEGYSYMRYAFEFIPHRERKILHAF